MSKVAAPIYFVAFAFGAIASKDQLIRVSCVLSLAVATLMLLSWDKLSGPSQKRLGVGVLLAMAFSLGFVMFVAGGALNGRIDGERYYLVEHGVPTLVSKRAYYGVAAVETLMVVSWPLGFLLGGRGRLGARRASRPTIG